MRINQSFSQNNVKKLLKFQVQKIVLYIKLSYNVDFLIFTFGTGTNHKKTSKITKADGKSIHKSVIGGQINEMVLTMNRNLIKI